MDAILLCPPFAFLSLCSLCFLWEQCHSAAVLAIEKCKVFDLSEQGDAGSMREEMRVKLRPLESQSAMDCVQSHLYVTAEAKELMFCPHNNSCYMFHGEKISSELGGGSSCLCFKDMTNKTSPVIASSESCEWKIVFKAIAGNNRQVYRDFLEGGAINVDKPEAEIINSSLPFRDPDVLENWEAYTIHRVKVEIFQNGERKAWVIFDGIDSNVENWFRRDRQVWSSFGDIKDKKFNFFSMEGLELHGRLRRFYINRSFHGCPNDCGYLMVIDSIGDLFCPWEKLPKYPVFMYGKLFGGCSIINDKDQVGLGDRFVISVKTCS